MLSHQDQLIELVRELESRNYIFATDPVLVNDRLKANNSPTLDKLYQRAKAIDSNQSLSHTLEKIDARIKAIIIILSVLWSISGFFGLFALLQSNVVNFFYVLLCLLGVHTLTLCIWLGMTLTTNPNKPSLFATLLSPSQLIRGNDDVTQSAVALYERQIRHAGMRWYIGKISHQLWLATLIGMLGALVVLLMVRNFSFIWESTLLSADSMRMLIHGLAWLPDLVGFPTPSEEQIAQSQYFAQQAKQPLTASIVSSYEWAMLLISSILIYAIVPRFLLWLSCLYLFKQKKMTIDLNQPYYQKLLNYWSNEVVDADDFAETAPTALVKVEISHGQKLAVLLEYPCENKQWYQAVTDDSDIITDFELVDDREQIQRLINYLQQNKLQVLLGIQLTCLPDRGTIRKIDKIASQAQDGLIVCLLDNKNQQDEEKNIRLQQWQQLLTERNISFLTLDN